MAEVEQTTEAGSTENQTIESPVEQNVEASGVGEQEVTPTPEAPAYTPNFKFKASGAEHELPDYVRGILTDAEKEKQIKEVYEKAFGLDKVKEDFKTYQSKYDTTTQELSSYKQSVEELKSDYQRGDMDSLFTKLNIPQEKILQYVLDKLKYNELPPEQKQVLDQKRSVEQRLMQYERQNQEMQTKYQEQATAAKQFALDVLLDKSDVKSAAESYDAKVGKPGAFRNLVVDRGKYHWYESQGKLDLTPDQAIKEALSLIGWNGQTEISPTPGATQAQPRREPTVIPNISGRSSSPVSKKPSSIKDLKEIYKHMNS